MKTFDCVVIGGGMVGAASALSLAELGLTVAVVEKYAPMDFSPEQALDLRVSAISLLSIHLLEQLNAWQQIQQWRSCPYQRLGVWEHELCYTEFDAKDIQQKNLGCIVENRLIQLSLWQQIAAHPKVTLFCPNKLINFEQDEQTVLVELDSGEISTKLLIAADGANSQVRQLADIGMTGWDYKQSAMLINVETELAQQDITWQQFFETGPVAMLPMPGESPLGGYASLVWYHQRDEIKRLSSLSNQQLQQEVIAHFPAKLGHINVIDKAAFPLTRRHANSYQNKKILLLGDAAHTINPMAGQGVNLGFKDVKALQSVVASAIGNNECWHQPQTLARYEKMRRHDNLLMMSTMDALYTSFSHPSPFVKIVRNAGLFAAKHAPFFKNKALAYACGM
ncbi:MAG: FAD-dependent monooxygenase [Colwellia sp.]|nr:FAD-dependent monooxygenase [Colwellia sp.]